MIDLVKQALDNATETYRAGMEQGRAQHTDAQKLLAAAVSWHRANESAELPDALLAILVAARRVC